MEQTSNAGGEDGGAKKEAAELERKKSSGQETDPSPNPEPKSSEAIGEQQNDKQKSENNSSAASLINEDINRNNMNNESTESGSDKSASPLNSKSKKSVRWSQELVSESPEPRSRTVSFPEEHGSNPYVARSPAPSDNSSSINIKDAMDSVKDVLGRWGRNVREATKKAEDLAENTWQHSWLSITNLDASLPNKEVEEDSKRIKFQLPCSK